MSVKNLEVSETDSYYLTEEEKITEMKNVNLPILSDQIKEAKEDI